MGLIAPYWNALRCTTFPCSSDDLGGRIDGNCSSTRLHLVEIQLMNCACVRLSSSFRVGYRQGFVAILVILSLNSPLRIEQ